MTIISLVWLKKKKKIEITFPLYKVTQASHRSKWPIKIVKS